MEPTELEKLNEAEQYHLKALFILHQLQANKKVYGSNSTFSGTNPANTDLALQYINRSLTLFPENAVYLNLKALLLWEGKGQKEEAVVLLEKAALLKPRDIDIQNNLKAIKKPTPAWLKLIYQIIIFGFIGLLVIFFGMSLFVEIIQFFIK